MIRHLLATLLCVIFGGFSIAQSLTDSEQRIITHHDYKVTSVTTPSGLNILKNISNDILIDEPLLPDLVGILLRMCVSEEGVGIAAPQIGINRNVFVLQRFDAEGEPYQEVINPEIIWASELYQKGPEGCLSIPDFRSDIWRHYAIQVRYFNLKGEMITEVLEGFTAVIFQHEYDHLVGRLITDVYHKYLAQKIRENDQNLGKLQ